MMQIVKAETFVGELLQSKISPLLTYHDYFHTLDVVKSAKDLAREEGITKEEDVLLLLTAALFHDCGYVSNYENHEAESCRFAEKTLPAFEYTKKQIDTVCSMIMKTRLPSAPDTILEKILCDADLDYLGRDDFFELGNKLFCELLAMNKISSEKEWDKMQIRFLESHHYLTDSARKKRDEKKAENLKRLKIKSS